MSLRSRALRGACAAVLAPAAIALSACGSSDGGATAASKSATAGPVPQLAADQKVDITWETYNLASPGPTADTVKGLVADFEKAHPNITVHAQAPSGTDFSGSVQREIVAGKAPDVAQLGLGTELDFIADTLKVRPLQDVVGQAAIDDEFGGDHPYHPNAAKLSTLDGKTYGIPYVFSTPIVYLNEKLAKAAGLASDAPLTTWDEVGAAAQQIHDKTGAGGIGFACLDAVTNGDWCLQGLIRSNGGQVISDDGKTLSWTDPGTVGALSKLQSIVKAGGAPDMNFNDAVEAFMRGKLGMLLTTSVVQGGLIGAAKAGHYDITAIGLPQYGDTPSVPTNSGSGLYILSTDPAKARASWELIQFLTSDASETKITQNIGYLPLRTSLLDDPAYLKSWGDAQKQLIDPNVGQLDRLQGVKPFPGRQYAQIRKQLTDAAAKIVYGGADAQSTLDSAQKQAEGMMPNG
jgi:multiple sugar transport system substrate-binding protein